jgi:hypothetical protein
MSSVQFADAGFLKLLNSREHSSFYHYGPCHSPAIVTRTL